VRIIIKMRLRKLFLLFIFEVLMLSLSVNVYSAASNSPAPPSGPSGPVKVAFIGDQDLNSNSKAVLNLIKNEGTDFVIHSGDFDYADNPAAWDDQISSILGPDYPYFASIGNHDSGRWPGYQERLQTRLSKIQGATCTGDLGVKSACKYKGIFFLLTGAGEKGTGHDIYIKDQLAQDSSTWSICSWHKNQNAMQVGAKPDQVGWEPYNECLKGGAIIATAHEHTYARTKTLNNVQNQIVDPYCSNPNVLCVAPGKTFVFHSGLGGRSIRKQVRCLPTTYPYGCNGEWAKIYTSNQNAQYGALFITFNYNGNTSKAYGEFKNIQGQVIDSFIIVASDLPSSSDTTLPTVSITNPANNAQVSGTITIT